MRRTAQSGEVRRQQTPDRKEKARRTGGDGLLKTLSSLKLTVAVLFIISLLCLVGTIFTQGGHVHGWAARLPRLISPYDIFRSVWFLGAGLLLCVNLTLCMRKRLSLKRRGVIMLLLHGSVVLIIAGYAAGFAGLDGYLEIPQGSSVSQAVLKNGALFDLGFTVRCDRFTMELYENGMPKEFVSDLSFLKGGRVDGQAQLRVNHPARFSGISLYQESYRQSSRADMTLSDGKRLMKFKAEQGEVIPLPSPGIQIRVEKVWSDLMGAGPAVKLLIEGPDGGSYLWVFKEIDTIRARMPDLFEKMPAFDPSSFRPYTFSLHRLESSYATGIGVKRDPGVPLVGVGGVLFLVSLLLVFLTTRASFVPGPDSGTAPGESHGEKGPAPDAQGEGGRA